MNKKYPLAFPNILQDEETFEEQFAHKDFQHMCSMYLRTNCKKILPSIIIKFLFDAIVRKIFEEMLAALKKI